MLDGSLTDLNLGIICAPSGAGAVLLHGEEHPSAFVVFWAFRPSDGVHSAAIATFEHCSQSVFGYPNDEAYFAVSGASYGFSEVTGSDWPDRVSAFNRRAFPDSPSRSDSRHFFMGSHDVSGQFLAKGLTIELVADGFAEALRIAVNRISSNAEEL